MSEKFWKFSSPDFHVGSLSFTHRHFINNIVDGMSCQRAKSPCGYLMILNSLFYTDVLLRNMYAYIYITFCDNVYYSELHFLIFTGSIARSENLPVFSLGLLRGRFWGFSPRRGDTLHRWGVKAWRRGPKVMPNFTPSVQRQGCRTPKIEIFTQIWPKCGI